MARGAGYRVPFRRRREGRTDYRRRLRLLRGGQPRVVVRKSLRGLTIQFALFDTRGDTVRAMAVSNDLREFGWTAPGGNLPAAYLTGLLAGKRAASQGITAAVLDLGRNFPAKGGRLFAALKGVLDAGVSVPHSDDVLPEDFRLTGQHISPDVASLFGQVKSKLEAM
jgi:large subunit ribosomal protein L18